MGTLRSSDCCRRLLGALKGPATGRREREREGEMDLTRDSSPGLPKRGARLQMITRGDQVVTRRQQKPQTPPAPPV
eukprot:9871919-Prorocentrum_lima.AAC.1